MDSEETNMEPRLKVAINVLWQAISFFSSPFAVQRPVIGECKYDFYWTNERVSVSHDRYLVGMYMVVVNLYWSIDEDSSLSQKAVSLAGQLKAQLDMMYWSTEKGNNNVWKLHELEHNPIWDVVRLVSGRLLAEAERVSTLSNDPICIEDYVDSPSDPSIIDFL